MSIDLFDKKALLFLPASNPRAIAKARTRSEESVHDRAKADGIRIAKLR